MATRNDFTENEKNSKSELNFSCPKCRCRWSGLRYNSSLGRRFRSVGRSNLLFVRYVDRGLRRIDNYGISNCDYRNGRCINLQFVKKNRENVYTEKFRQMKVQFFFQVSMRVFIPQRKIVTQTSSHSKEPF